MNDIERDTPPAAGDEPVLPLAPVLELIVGPPSKAYGQVGMKVREWKELRAVGVVTLTVAEDLADRLRQHPVEVWPDYYETVAGL